MIQLPPLRERDGDIMVLAMAFLQRFATENRKKMNGFTKEAIQALGSYNWPGNIRELENKVKRAAIMAEGPKITSQDLELASPYDRYEGRD